MILPQEEPLRNGVGRAARSIHAPCPAELGPPIPVLVTVASSDPLRCYALSCCTVREPQTPEPRWLSILALTETDDEQPISPRGDRSNLSLGRGRGRHHRGTSRFRAVSVA